MLVEGFEVAKQRSRHPNKEIEKALVYAESQGWRIIKLNGHAWGKIQCPWNEADCRCGTFCQLSVWSTPRVPENLARQLHRAVNGCERHMEKTGGLPPKKGLGS